MDRRELRIFKDHTDKHVDHLDEYRRTRFDIESSGKVIECYSSYGFGPWDFRKLEVGEWPASATIDDVIADLIKHHDSDWPPNYADEETLAKIGTGFDGRDLAVWRDGRILAVIRKDTSGKSTATKFEV